LHTKVSGRREGALISVAKFHGDRPTQLGDFAPKAVTPKIVVKYVATRSQDAETVWHEKAAD